MTVFKVALTNLVMWAREHYFPESFSQATWGRLAPFFHLHGLVRCGSNCVRSMIDNTTVIWQPSANA
jgi:hypothetical protein